MRVKPETNETVNSGTSRTAAAEIEKMMYTNGKMKVAAPTHSLHERETKRDLSLFLLVPTLFWKVTPIMPKYITGIARILSSAHLLLTLHYNNPCHYDADNKDIIKSIKDQYDQWVTTYYRLGYLNKIKHLNDGWHDIVKMILEDLYSKDKKLKEHVYYLY